MYRAQVHFARHRRGQQIGRRVVQTQNNDFTGKTSKLRRWQTSFSKNGLPSVQTQVPFKHKSWGRGPLWHWPMAEQDTQRSLVDSCAGKSRAWGRSLLWHQPMAERLLIAGACLTATAPGAEMCNSRKWPGLKYPTAPAASSSSSRWTEAFRRQSPQWPCRSSWLSVITVRCSGHCRGLSPPWPHQPAHDCRDGPGADALGVQWVGSRSRPSWWARLGHTQRGAVERPLPQWSGPCLSGACGLASGK